MALERIAKYNGCCAKIRRENTIKPETIVKENLTPVKPERKSRVTSVDSIKKSKTVEATTQEEEEATNLLSKPDSSQQKDPSRNSSVVAQTTAKRFSNVELRRENGTENETKNSPSCSSTNRRSKRRTQSVYDQKISSKIDEEIVVLRNPRKKLDETNETEMKKNEDIEAENKKVKSNIFRELIRRAPIRNYSIVMVLQWFSCYMAFHLLATILPNTNFNRHVTFALGGAIEIVAYTVIYFLLSKYGRRISLCGYQCTNGVIIIGLSLLISLVDSSSVWRDLTKTIVLLFGRVTVISTIAITYLYAVELFPTVVRGTCLGICTVFAEIGCLSMPEVLSLEKYVTVNIPLAIAGVLCFISGILAIILPETSNMILPDTIEDLERLFVRKKEQKNDEEIVNDDKNIIKDDLTDREILREKLFSEDWVDAGNGILVNFSENKSAD